VENGKQRGIEPQAERDGRDHRQCEARRAAETAERIAYILQQRFDPPDSARIAAVFFGLLDAANLHTSPPRGFPCIHPRRHVLARLHLDVEPQLLVELVLHPPPYQQRAQPQQKVAPLHLTPSPARARWPRPAVPSFPSPAP